MRHSPGDVRDRRGHGPDRDRHCHCHRDANGNRDRDADRDRDCDCHGDADRDGEPHAGGDGRRPRRDEQPDAGPTAVATVVAAPKPVAPKISTASFKRSKRTLTIAGTTAATGKVKVELSYKVGKKTIKKTLSVTIKAGKFSGTLKLSATDAKKASKLTVSVSSTGSPVAKKSVSVKK